ncbi:hypothetical protein KIPB_010047, partial [Kipferlia bialata]
MWRPARGSRIERQLLRNIG